MRRFFILSVVLSAVMVLFSACNDDLEDENFSSDDLIGTWRVNNTQEFWRYNRDATGVTWDESDDVHASDQTTMNFTWKLVGDQLQHIFSGDEVHQAVVEDRQITQLDETTLHWFDGLKSVTLVKVE